MKIAFITGVFFPRAGGAQVQAHNIANRLTKLGIKTRLFLFNKTNIQSYLTKTFSNKLINNYQEFIHID